MLSDRPLFRIGVGPDNQVMFTIFFTYSNIYLQNLPYNCTASWYLILKKNSLQVKIESTRNLNFCFYRMRRAAGHLAIAWLTRWLFGESTGLSSYFLTRNTKWYMKLQSGDPKNWIGGMMRW